MEQQPPCGQFPQTVLPLPAPQVPSVVMAPVGGAFVGAPNTGSACDDVGVDGLVSVPPVPGSGSGSVPVPVPVPPPPVMQPLWHPCALSQLIHSQPGIKSPFTRLTEHLSFHTIYRRSRVSVFLVHWKRIEHITYPADEQQPPNSPFGSHGAPPNPEPH